MPENPFSDLSGSPSVQRDFSDSTGIIKNAPIGIFVSTPEGRFVSVNPAMARIFGYDSPSEMVTSITDIESQLYLDPADRKEFTQRLSDNREMVDFEYRLRRKDGSVFWISTSARAVRDPSGRIVEYHGFTTDIDQRKRTEQKYKMLVENLNEIVYKLDDKAVITYVSPNVETLSGYTATEITGRNFIEFVHPEDVNGRLEQYNTIMSGVSEPSEYRLVTKDGRSLWIRTCAKPVIENGKTVGIQGVLTDIDDRKQAEEALRESRRQLFTLISNLPGMVFRCRNDSCWTMEFLSDGCRPLTGRDPEELIGNARISYAEIIHPEDRQNVWKEVQAAVSEKRAFEIVYRIIAAGGEEKWVWEKGQPVFDDQKNLFCIEGFVIDVTEQLEARKEQQILQEQLAQSRKMESLGRLAGGVAHDFNNMLSVINGYAEMLTDSLSPSDPAYGSIRQIHEAGKRSAEVVRKLLAFARKQTISPEIMNLNDNVASMLKMLRKLIGENIELRWKPDATIRPVRMDPSQLDQILANLVINARDAISETGTIVLETKNTDIDEAYCAGHKEFFPGRFVMLSVTDNGCGMSREVRENLFEPFFTTKDKFKGSGFGLATIYGIVKQNNGFINVYSEPGLGTAVRIYLPRHEAGEAGTGEAEAKKEDVSTTGRGETILLLEDEPEVLELAKTMLEKLGYTVLAAATPSSAMAAARSHKGKIDLLLTDIVLPEMNGREFADQLFPLFPDIRILFMSGYTSDVIARNHALEKGVNFLEKPFSMKNLALKLREALEAG